MWPHIAAPSQSHTPAPPPGVQTTYFKTTCNISIITKQVAILSSNNEKASDFELKLEIKTPGYS